MEEHKEGRYRVEQVLSERHLEKVKEPGIQYFTAKDQKTQRKCLISKITGRELIQRCLPELINLDQKGISEEFIDCFSEHSEVYVVFQRQDLVTLQNYLKETTLEIEERLKLFQKILKEIMRYAEFPELLQAGLFDPEFILIENGTPKFNWKVDMTSLRQRKEELIRTLFFPEEMKKHSGLWLLLERVQKNIKASSEELLQETEQLLKEEQKRKKRNEEKQEKGKQAIKIIGRAAAGIGIAVGILLLIRALLLNTDQISPTTQDISSIGTVQINQSLEETESD